MANWPLGVTHARAGDVELVLDALVDDDKLTLDVDDVRLVLDSLVDDVESEEVLEATHDPDSVTVTDWVIVVLTVVLSVEKLLLIAVDVAVAVSVAVLVSVIVVLSVDVPVR